MSGLKTVFRSLAVVSILGFAPAANAALIIDTTGASFITQPDGSTTTNDILGNPTSGWVGAQLTYTGSKTLRFTYLGKEAGWDNTLIVDSNFDNSFGGSDMKFSTRGGDKSSVGDSFTIDGSMVNGAIPFIITTSGKGGGSVTNGLNPNNLVDPIPIFIIATSSNTFGNGIFIGFDDGGGRNDNDFSDLVFRVDVIVLEPLTLGLIGAGLAGIGLARRRRRA